MANDRPFPPPPLDFSRSRDVAFDTVYYGDTTLDRRHTPAMLPWLVAGVRRRSKGQSVRLVVGDGILSAFLTNDASPQQDRTSNHPHSAHVTALFSHRLSTMTRFARIVHNPSCFSYLTRPNTDSPFVCHVFEAKHETTVRIEAADYWKQFQWLMVVLKRTEQASHTEQLTRCCCTSTMGKCYYLSRDGYLDRSLAILHPCL